MSVVSAREHWDGRSGSFEGNLNTRVSRKWLVKTDNKFDDAVTIRNYFANVLGLVYLISHPSNVFMTLRSLRCEPMSESPFAWDVTAEYSTAPLQEDEEEQQGDNPLLRPAKVSGGSEMASRFTVTDKDGKPVMNSAKDIMQPWEVDDPRGTLHITRNFASLPDFCFEYLNKVNETDFTVMGKSIGARQAKFQGYSFSDPQTENDISFITVTVDLSLNPNTWDAERLDEGLQERVGGNLTKILNDDGEPVPEPVPLDGSGAKRASPTTNNAVYITYKYYKEADFNAIFA